MFARRPWQAGVLVALLARPALADGGYPALPAAGCPAVGDFGRRHHAVVGVLASCAAGAAHDGRILRGGVPSVAGLACLKSEGVTAVIDLRTEGEAAGQRQRVEAAGMSYLPFPMVTAGARGPRACRTTGRPAAACNALALEEALAALAAALAASPRAKVYVHCARGEDRTGLLIAALRLRQGCSPAEARREMRAHHYTPYPPLEAVWASLTAKAP